MHGHAFTDLIAVLEVWKHVVDKMCGLGKRVGGHADIAESSVMMALHPELVAEDEAVAGYLPQIREDVIERILRDGFASVTSSGILGDARGMSKDIGERCIDELADVIAAHFAGSTPR